MELGEEFHEYQVHKGIGTQNNRNISKESYQSNECVCLPKQLSLAYSISVITNSTFPSTITSKLRIQLEMEKYYSYIKEMYTHQNVI